MPEKPDAGEIRAFMATLAAELGLDPAREWWPKYLYRSDHVENTANILNAGELLSRAEALSSGRIVKDSASRGIIGGLGPSELRWVRLYFRPRAPTQYRNEGIRPIAKYEYDSHMPVPVYLLFKSGDLLSQEGICFTRGRLRNDPDYGEDVEFLRSIPFRDVFHDKGTGDKRKAEIIDARHAEVLVRDRLPLDLLKFIVCRSAPERDTLLSLLDARTRKRWAPAIILENARRFFHKRGTFVSEVLLEPARSRFTFFPSTEGPEWNGPFHLIGIWEVEGGGRERYEANEFHVGPTPLGIKLTRAHAAYRVRLTLNGDLAYNGEFRSDQRPIL